MLTEADGRRTKLRWHKDHVSHLVVGEALPAVLGPQVQVLPRSPWAGLTEVTALALVVLLVFAVVIAIVVAIGEPETSADPSERCSPVTTRRPRASSFRRVGRVR